MKKNAHIGLRLSEEQLKSFEDVAAATNDTASGLVRLLVESYINAYKKHGRRVIYPPEYRLYAVLEKEHADPPQPKTQKKSNQRTA